MHIDLKLCAKIRTIPLYKHLVSNPISHSIDTSITHDDTHFTLTPIELIKDCGEPLLNTFERLKRESYWMVLIGTIKPMSKYKIG